MPKKQHKWREEDVMKWYTIWWDESDTGTDGDDNIGEYILETECYWWLTIDAW